MALVIHISSGMQFNVHSYMVHTWQYQDGGSRWRKQMAETDGGKPDVMEDGRWILQEDSRCMRPITLKAMVHDPRVLPSS